MTSRDLQRIIHDLDSARWVKWVRVGLLVMAILYVAHLWLFREGGFRGLAHEKAMDQAQIAREIARGNGFSTKLIRPAAIGQLERKWGEFPKGPLPDTYHAPLNPAVSALVLSLARGAWQISPQVAVHPADKLLAGLQLLFFLLAVLVSYRTAKRLFDRPLALVGMAMLLMAQVFWDFAMSGLPQMLLLFLFSGAAYVMVRLLEARQAGATTWRWSAALGALFGLLALTHALTLFLFVGSLVFAALLLRPRGRDAGIMLLVCACFVIPWATRNAVVCGDPLGIARVTWLTGLHGSESRLMRLASLEGLSLTPPAFLGKMLHQLVDQLADLFRLLGSVLLAPIFFVSLLHLFRKPETALFRWWLLSLWVAGLLGMAFVGLDAPQASLHPVPVRANDLHVLFIPLMTFYGLAFALVLWSRLELAAPILRTGFLALITAISTLPFLTQLVELQRGRGLAVHWPPYFPPTTALLREWTTEGEVIMSDMPWAVAWYADRRSLWLPSTLSDYYAFNDYDRLHAPIVGLYLTPVSGDQPFYGGLVNGEYKSWGRIITRNFDLTETPLKFPTAMPVDAQCIFYADRVRWGGANSPAELGARATTDAATPEREPEAKAAPAKPASPADPAGP